MVLLNYKHMVMKNTMTAGTALGPLPWLHHGTSSAPRPAPPLDHQSKCLSIIMESFDFIDPQDGLKHPQRSVDHSVKTMLDHKEHMW